MMTAEEVIQLLRLEPHPREGGYFIETYRSAQHLPPAALPTGYTDPRSFGTAIYYLLTTTTRSTMHRLIGDEIFHFYLGDPVEMLLLCPDGSSEVLTLGTDLKAGMRPQAVVPGGVWQGARMVPGGRYALLGTTMSPGFDYRDYEDGERAALIAQYPNQAERIRALTR